MKLLPALLALAALGAGDRKLAVVARGDEIAVVRPGATRPLLVQNAKAGFRPYVHPIVAPDGRGELTEFSPGHHRHQTGLYWGFTRLNGRDYFHHPGDGYFERRTARIVTARGPVVRWETTYRLMGEDGPVLEERQRWSMRDGGDRYVIDLAWHGTALVDVTVGRYDYGGLFLRMPWREGMEGSATNAEGLAGGDAEGGRSPWVDVALRVEGRADLAHVAILDHPANPGHPTPWRVDGQLGVGPCLARLGDWRIPKGETAVFRHRFVVYTGAADPALLRAAWNEFAKSPLKEDAR